MSARSPEGRAARILKERLSVFDFSEKIFAYMLHHGASEQLQIRLFNVFMHLVRHWTEDLDNSRFSKESYDIKINAARIRDTMEKYGYKWTE